MASACISVVDASSITISGQIFNVGSSNENYTKKQLANIIQKHVSDIKIEIVKSKTDPRNYKVSFDKIKRILNFQPKWTVENSVVEILSKIEDGTVDPRQSEFSNMSKLTTEINALTNYQFDENL